MAARKNSASEVKKTQKCKITGTSDSKSYECEVCQSVVGTEDKAMSVKYVRNGFTGPVLI